MRRHLAREAKLFERGVFADPAQVHGHEMPGVAELEAGAARIDVRYERVPRGGRISYATSDPALVSAIHAWFRAQVMDRGRRAEGDL